MDAAGKRENVAKQKFNLKKKSDDAFINIIANFTPPFFHSGRLTRFYN